MLTTRGLEPIVRGAQGWSACTRLRTSDPLDARFTDEAAKGNRLVQSHMSVSVRARM